ncbi:NAD(P)/FAD-dependent oxidoreductase [Streptomyces cremeus]
MVVVTRSSERRTDGVADAYDVVVVGGGAGGMAAALVLGRVRRSVLVVDAGEPRNAPAAHMQGYPSRDGMPPGEFLAVVRAEVAGYGGEVLRDTVTEVVPDGTGEFDVVLAGGGRVHARRVVVATGLVDELPELPGVAERWGREVLHCPYCHGWEVRDGRIGVLYRAEAGVHQALLFSQLSSEVTLFLDGAELPGEERELIAAAGVRAVAGKLAGLVVEDDRLTGVRLADGEVHEASAFVVAPRMVPRDGVLTALGVRTQETPAGTFPQVDPTGLTSFPGVWAVGNATGAAEQVVNAAGAGYRAGTAVNMSLLEADLAVSRQRAEFASAGAGSGYGSGSGSGGA